jgi:molecular chaperone GrpE
MTAGADKDELLRRFGKLLDSALASEAPPAGIDPQILEAALAGDATAPDRLCDSYALWTAMTALTQEIRLQGRAFQELKHALETQAADRERLAQKDAQRETERRCRKEALNALIDLRDRLVRGRESARAARSRPMAPTPWWARFLPKPAAPPDAEAIDALLRGYELGIERVDQTLGEFGAREIRCQGEPFDPRRMNAIDSEETSEVPDGTVREVYRSGFEWNGEVFRTAQVRVSRARSTLNS